ncbi:MAG: discoidin domain-containing protein, partial [Armatimonadia bacterium]
AADEATQPPFVPPGPNIALHKPYALDPAPNYGDCSLDEKHVLLTDGEYTKGYFWVQKTSVGWVNKQPIAIVFDLGQVEPIAGLSFNTAAGVAGVVWPASLRIMVSDDRKQWTVVGDLVVMSNKRWAPAPKPYSVHRFATGDLQARGRYVALIVDQTPYAVVDEIEIYQGPQSLLTQAPRGKQVTQAPLEYWKSRKVVDMIQSRLRADLAQVREGLGKAKLSEAQKAQLLNRAEKLAVEIDTQEDVPEGFTTLLPLNDLHRQIYALNAPILRDRGYKGLTAWGGYRYDPLQPLDAPGKPGRPSPLNVRMMRNEHRAEVLNLTNATEGPVVAAVKASGLRPGCLTLHGVMFTDTREGTPVAAALSRGEPGERGLQVTVPAGTTSQVWLDFNSQNVPAGGYRATLDVACPGQAKATVPISLHVASPVMPREFSVAIGGWDETNGKGSYDVTMDNMAALIKNLREHGVNMPWNNPRAVPFGGQYDAEGNLIAPLDFSTWDEWVNRWPGAQHWGVFANVRNSFNNEPMGTPRFNKMVGAWTRAWVQHAEAQGLKPGQIKLLLVDEPHAAEQDKIIIAWAKAIHAAEPGIVIWNDPTHADPSKAEAEFYTTSDVLSPNATLFLRGGKPYQDVFVEQQRAGRELWFYSCSGPAKLLDPGSYWRGQFWLNLKYGGKGSCYWAFGDEGGNSWNAYLQARASFSPLFLGRTEVTDAKQMEAIREGAEDYEYFVMLRARVAELEGKGVQSKLVAQAKALLVTGPEQAVAIMGGEAQKWAEPKDRTVMDTVRLQALDMLEKLSQF